MPAAAVRGGVLTVRQRPQRPRMLRFFAFTGADQQSSHTTINRLNLTFGALAFFTGFLATMVAFLWAVGGLWFWKGAESENRFTLGKLKASKSGVSQNQNSDGHAARHVSRRRRDADDPKL